MKNTKQRNNFTIEYKKAEAGWLDMVFSNGVDTFALDISAVFDPFEDWFYTLERICKSNIPSIVIEPEGPLLRIDIIPTNYPALLFKILYHKTNEVLFYCESTQERVLEQMYVKFMEFTRSDKYDMFGYEHYDKSAFSLKNYSNKNIEEMLEDKIFKNFSNTTHCKYCNQHIEVKTIDDMLKRAYDIIDNDEKITKLLEDLRLDKYNVGISQEHSRLAKIGLPNGTNMSVYRCIQEHESGIYLGFNENFTQLEKIEIKKRIFREGDIRGYMAQFNTWTHEEKINFLDKAFSSFDASLKGLNTFIEINGDDEILLKTLNGRGFYPPERDMDNRYPYFYCDTYSTYEEKSAKVKSFCLELCDPYPIEGALSEWLHQKIYTIMSNLGGVYLWYQGSASDIRSLGGYDLENSKLGNKIDKWQDTFETTFETTDFDWEEYRKIGNEIFLELRDLVKNDYIITYAKSIDETCGTYAERAKRD